MQNWNSIQTCGPKWVSSLCMRSRKARHLRPKAKKIGSLTVRLPERTRHAIRRTARNSGNRNTPDLKSASKLRRMREPGESLSHVITSTLKSRKTRGRHCKESGSYTFPLWVAWLYSQPLQYLAGVSILVKFSRRIFANAHLLSRMLRISATTKNMSPFRR